jgi:hypothetical protein
MVWAIHPRTGVSAALHISRNNRMHEANAPDQRVRRVSQAFVKHLRAFIREIEPTEASGSGQSTSSQKSANCARMLTMSSSSCPRRLAPSVTT